VEDPLTSGCKRPHAFGHKGLLVIFKNERHKENKRHGVYSVVMHKQEIKNEWQTLD